MGMYMGTREASENWGYSQYQISMWCRAGLIENAEQDKIGSPWRIPISAECPMNVKNRIVKKTHDK